MKTLLKGIELLPNSVFTYKQSLPRLLGKPRTREHREGSTRIEITAEERKVCDTLHSASKVRFMDMASLHLGRDTENQPRRAKVQNNKSQVSLVSPRAELKEYTALVFWDQALQLEKLQLFFSLEGLQIRQLCHILLLPLGHLTGFKKKVLQSQNYFALICILRI